MNIKSAIEKYDKLVADGEVVCLGTDECFRIEDLGGNDKFHLVYNAYRYGFIKGMLQVHNDNWINEKAAKG